MPITRVAAAPIKLEPKITISDDFASNTHMATTPDLFGSVAGDINMMEPGLVAFEGDFNLQVYAVRCNFYIIIYMLCVWGWGFGVLFVSGS